jgi:hypothetical protein
MTSISSTRALVYPEQLSSPIERIYANPALRALINQIGEIQIKIADCEGHPAKWCWGEKTIKVDPNLHETEPDMIASLVFELFNAFQTPALKKAVDTKADVEDLVRSIEKIEYHSAILTNAAMKSTCLDGVEHDFFHVSPDFEIHYALNQVAGHSEWLAKTYCPDQKLRGTLAIPLSELDREARQLIGHLIRAKDLGSQKMVNGKKAAFEDFIYALKQKSRANKTYKKVLECVEGLFLET